MRKCRARRLQLQRWRHLMNLNQSGPLASRREKHAQGARERAQEAVRQADRAEDQAAA